MSSSSPLRTRFSPKKENMFSAGLSMIRPKRRTSSTSIINASGPPSPPVSEPTYQASLYSPMSGTDDGLDSRLQHSRLVSNVTLPSSTSSIGSAGSGSYSISDDLGYGALGHSLDESIFLTPPRVSRAVCAVCDIRIGAGIMHEDTTSLSCGHLVHTECLQSLDGRAGDVATANACGICDLMAANKSTIAIPPASPLVLDGQPDSPISPSEFMDESFMASVEPLSSLSSLSLFDTHKASSQSTFSLDDDCSMEDTDDTGSLSITAVPERETMFWGENSVNCLVEVSCGKNAHHHSVYRHTAADMSYARKKGREIAALKFMGRPLGSHKMGKLRLVDRMSVTNEELVWKMYTCYLFEGSLVVTREAAGVSAPQIKALVDMDHHLEEATVHEVDGKLVLSLFLDSAELRELHFTTNNADTLRKWCQAIHNTPFCYPLAPSSRSLSMPNGSFKERAPLELVLCVPAHYLTDSLKFRQLAEILANIHENMMFFDKLGLVFYGRRGITSIPLRASSWHGWEGALQSHASALTEASCRGLSDVLEHTSQLLKNHKTSRSTASVVVVGYGTALNLSDIPWGFLYAKTPIHTFGVGDHQDAVTLSRLADATGGQYVSLNSRDDLVASVSGTVERETQLSHKNVRLMLKPPPGATIKSIRGWNMATPAAPGLNLQDQGIELGEPTKAGDKYVVALGNMAAGDYRSISVCVEFSDIVSRTVARLGERPTLMQVTTASEGVLGGAEMRDNRVVNMQVNFSAMPAPMPAPAQNMAVLQREIQCLAADTMELAVGFMGQKDYRRIIRVVDEAIAKFQARCDPIAHLAPANRDVELTVQLASYLLERVESLSEQALLGGADTIPAAKDILAHIWCLRSQRSWEPSMPLVEMFLNAHR